MMPRLRERRAGALLAVDGAPSDMPSGPFGLESRPPMLGLQSEFLVLSLTTLHNSLELWAVV
jgi:hypothetical protein